MIKISFLSEFILNQTIYVCVFVYLMFNFPFPVHAGA